jgi:penicillin-binding protein 1A
MVGGRDYNQSPFNLATEGERQPGSSFKPFVLAEALEQGISPDSEWTSKLKEFPVPHSSERFVVHNDEGNYTGVNTLTGATAYSDNSIYAEVGIKVGTRHIAKLAHRMGIRTPISTNYAMTIGGLNVGVTPLDMAHAYETIAHGGQRVSGTLVDEEAPVGIEEVDAGKRVLPDGHHHDVDHPTLKRILPQPIASTETSMLETVLQYGTAKAAAIGQFAAGKTGTTSNYGDAWFVGWDSKYTVAVWVGYPNRLIPMTTQFQGGPVLGGTFPALIWHNFMLSALQIEKDRADHTSTHGTGAGGETGTGSTATGPEATTKGEEATTKPKKEAPGGKSPSTGGGGATGGEPSEGTAPASPAPTTAPAPSGPPGPTPAPSTPPAGAPSNPSTSSSGGTGAPAG